MIEMGLWKWDKSVLPKYEYTGGYPVMAEDKAGKDSMQPKDPCFILGNHKMILFTHVSGMYELISGERGWARLNHGGKNIGWNQATVYIRENSGSSAVYNLVGDISETGMITEQCFGTGYAKYQYLCPNHVQITKKLSVQPSLECGKGNSAFLIEVTIKNRSQNQLNISYDEEIISNYKMITHQDENMVSGTQRVNYNNTLSLNHDKNLVKSEIGCEAVKLLRMPQTPEQSYTYYCFPPTLFLRAVESKQFETKVAVKKNKLGEILSGTCKMDLAPGERKTIRMVIGFTFDKNALGIEQQIEDMLSQAMETEDGAYSHLWKKLLPTFEQETDETLLCEMIWNDYVLECMATYHQYFDETFIPQGSVYAYHLGQNASNRDNLQHLLPMIYANPKLAKSCLRFAMKHTLPDGEICRQDIGYGYRDPGIYMESDAQIYMIMAVGEYLRVTSDYDFLQEEITYYPVEYGKKDTVFHVLMNHFIYLRDTIGIGQHGLIRMLNSDWSDSFFHHHSPNIFYHFAESHMNTTMAVAVIPLLVKELEQYAAKKKSTLENTNMVENIESMRDVHSAEKVELAEVTNFIEEMKAYREKLNQAFLKDMEGRTFAPRAYIGEHDEPDLKFGMEHLCLEAQPFILQMEDFPLERKQKLWQEIKNRVMDQEKIGARNREVPIWDSLGHGEDGGIWFSHQGALMSGLVTFDKEAALAVLEKLTFHHYAKEYPEYVVGHWTYADSLESTLSDREGLYQFWIPEAFQPFCAHAHAWMLYTYYRILE